MFDFPGQRQRDPIMRPSPVPQRVDRLDGLGPGVPAVHGRFRGAASEDEELRPGPGSGGGDDVSGGGHQDRVSGWRGV